jgi:ABC-type transporter Mla maintaining outer membrane lipid asymmetry ATPase subunit MlaF
MQCAFNVASRVVLLHEGRLRFDGAVEALRQSGDPYVRAFVRGTEPPEAGTGRESPNQ